MSGGERKLSQTPAFIFSGLAFFLVMQLIYHHFYSAPTEASYRNLEPPLEAKLYYSLSLGSDRLLSYMLLIGVQLHDNQKGLHVSYNNLNYQFLSDWLLTLYELNPLSEYPAFLASRVYSQVKGEAKIRQMVGVIETLFNKNPQQHWRRMTEACLLLKHKLNDLPGALRVAGQIASLPKSVNLPYWARDMKLVLLDELGQLESAQLLVSSMLQSGEVKDSDEIRFLQMRLLKIQQELLSNRQIDD